MCAMFSSRYFGNKKGSSGSGGGMSVGGTITYAINVTKGYVWLACDGVWQSGDYLTDTSPMFLFSPGTAMCMTIGQGSPSSPRSQSVQIL